MKSVNSHLKVADINQIFVILLAMVSIMFVASAYAWLKLPAEIQIPVHWGLDGEPDRFSGKLEGLLMMPSIGLLSAIVLRFIPLIEPRRKHFLQSIVAYRIVSVMVLAFLTVVHVINMANLLKLTDLRVSLIIGLLLSILIVIVGNYLGKIRSNFMFGIRTPWTLSNDLVWDKTHRFGGKLLVVTGFFGIVLNLLMPERGVLFFLVLLVAVLVVIVVYSYFLWRSESGPESG